MTSAAHLAVDRPNLLFVHLSDPDQAGHESGWMGNTYGRAIATTDAALGRLLSATDEAYGSGNYSVIVTADHGGHDYDHGSDDPRDVTIPWIAWGQGVRQGTLNGVRIETFDTAPTVLWMLGVPKPARLGRLARARRLPSDLACTDLLKRSTSGGPLRGSPS